MSSLIYGTLSRRRLDTSPAAPLVFAEAPKDDELRHVGGEPSKTKETVSHWQDSLAALVPAEVLAFHAVAMTLGTSTSGTGDDTTTVITSPNEMTFVFGVLVVVAFLLYLLGAKSFRLQDFLRASIASVAFVLWTMIQPSTAFDALGWDPSSLIRIMVALVGAVLLGFAANALATKADETNTDKTDTDKTETDKTSN
jgi:predicted lipoprotein with Yx(FWY)xxD motif